MLDHNTFVRLLEIVTETGRYRDREALLAGLDHAFRARLDLMNSPAEQIAADLRRLVTVAEGGDLEPLRCWLSTLRRSLGSDPAGPFVDQLLGALGAPAPTPPLDWQALLARLRAEEFAEVMRCIERTEAVALLAPRGVGGAPLVAALSAHLSEARPGWRIVPIEARPHEGEDVDAYQERMSRRVERVRLGSAERRVALVHTWSAHPRWWEHQRRLGEMLRQRIESPGADTPVLVAVGGFALYRLARGERAHSVLNAARQIWLDDFEPARLEGLVDGADGEAVVEAGAGHAGVLRALLEVRPQAAGWLDAVGEVWRQELHYGAALAAIAEEKEAVEAVSRLARDPGRVPLRRLRPLSAPFSVWFHGVGRREGPELQTMLVPRCERERQMLAFQLGP